jgi:hypothetical protein
MAFFVEAEAFREARLERALAAKERKLFVLEPGFFGAVFLALLTFRTGLASAGNGSATFASEV